MVKYLLPAGSVRPQAIGASRFGDFDLIIMFCLMMADVRVFSGSQVASFTLFELFAWGYCAPVVVGSLWIDQVKLPASCRAFLFPVCLYMGWLLVASLCGIVFRDDTSVLQNAKNILPSLVLVAFLFIRLRETRSIALLCNLYVVYCVLSCVLALLQFKFGSPYVRELVEGTEYKLDIEGALVANPVVGFSGHPNGFAVELLPGIVLSLLQLNGEIRDGWRVRLITVGVIAVLLIGMVLSQARGEMIFTCAGIAFILSPLGRTRAFIVKVGWVGTLILAIVLYNLHQAKIGDSPGAVTVETRFQLWLTAIDAMWSDGYVALLGNGTVYMEKWSYANAGWEFPDSHNVWIDQAVNFGLPALVFYLAIWRQLFRNIELRFSPQSIVERTLLDGFRAMMIALMGDYFFAAYGNVVGPVSQLFFFMALAVRIASFTADEPVARARLRGPRAALSRVAADR